MNQLGAPAEKLVAQKLKTMGWHTACNWQTSTCEIDIVAKKGKQVLFIEVRYRKNGSGLSSVGHVKQSKLYYAARLWCRMNSWEHTWRIVVAGVDASNCVTFRELTY
jgi:putative endonuclease